VQIITVQRRSNVAQKRLTKRAAPASAVEAPKPLPKRGESEPATYLCEDARTAVTAAEKNPMGGMCVKCNINPAHSEVDHLCYNCHRASKGFVFDDEKNRFVKEKR
jgi:hypothetical protein